MLGPSLPYFPDPLWKKKKNTQTLWMEIQHILDDVTESTMTALNFNFLKQIKREGGGWITAKISR